MRHRSLQRCCHLAIAALVASVPVAVSAAPLSPPAAQPAAASITVPEALQAAVDAPTRSADNVKRDGYRHPAQTLAFFGVAPGQTVVELTPGGGWYSEILAPLLRDRGTYVAAVVDPQRVAEGRGRDYQQRSRDGLQQKFSAAPAQYAKAQILSFDPAAPVLGPAASADVVLTFRNVHNWRSGKQAAGMFDAIAKVLKPGGVLGVVEHRARTDVPEDDDSGYVGQQQVIALAEAAGLRLDASSEVNANPRDTRDHPDGVWMLPPSNRHPAADAAKYRAIGESDRMTLRFVKR